MTILFGASFDGDGALATGDFTVLDGNVSRVSGECNFAALDLHVVEIIAVTVPADHWVQFTYGSLIDQVAGDNGVWAILRLVDVNNFYLFQANATVSRIYRKLVGAFVQLGSDGPGVVPTDVGYFEAQGSQLIAKINGNVVCGSPTDSNHTAAACGIGAACGPSTAATLDDLLVGDFEAGAVTLTADPGALTLTGQASTLVLELISEAGALTLTGADATLQGSADESVSADAGALGLDGADATLQGTADQAVVADRGALSVAGAEALFGPSASADPGVLNFTGADAVLSWTESVPAEAAALALEGADATLQGTGNESITADAGALDIAGADVALDAGASETLLAAAGALTPTGATASFDLSFTFQPGQCTLTGQAASFDLRMAADAALLEFAGADAAFAATGSVALEMEAGALLLQGADAQLLSTGTTRSAREIFVVEAGTRLFPV